MGKVYERMDDKLAEFIGRQHVFFVGTAPDSPDGHLNVSPKGLDTFRILGPNSVAYLDLTGSGIETVAHLRQNGRVTIMFCAFEGRPLIVRLYGRGRVVEPCRPGVGRSDRPLPRVSGGPLGGRGGRGAGGRLVRIRRAALRVPGRAVAVDRLRREEGAGGHGGVQGPEEQGEHRRDRRAPFGRGRRAMRATEPTPAPAVGTWPDALRQPRRMTRMPRSWTG